MHIVRKLRIHENASDASVPIEKVKQGTSPYGAGQGRAFKAVCTLFKCGLRVLRVWYPSSALRAANSAGAGPGFKSQVPIDFGVTRI